MKKIFLFLLVLISINSFSQSGYYITSADNTKLYVQEFGNGEPIILLSGGPGLNSNYLNPIWNNLSSDYKCVVLDQRGTGKSILPQVDSISLTIQNYIHDLEALQEHLKMDKVTLVGHSWGGMLAMEYASRHPEKLERLILLGPGGPTSNFTSYVSDNIRMRLHDEDIKEKRFLDSLKLPSRKSLLPGYYFDRARALAVKANIDDNKSRGQPGVNRYVSSSYFSIQSERIKLLRNYKGIVHIIQGRQDPIGASTVYEIRELLPQSQIHFIEKCGHFPWLENKNQILEFFVELRKSLKKS